MQHAADSRAAVRAGVILHAVCYKQCPVLNRASYKDRLALIIPWLSFINTTYRPSDWPGEKITYWSKASLDSVPGVHLWEGPVSSVVRLFFKKQKCKVVSSTIKYSTQLLS